MNSVHRPVLTRESEQPAPEVFFAEGRGQTMAQWAEELECSVGVLLARIRRDGSLTAAVQHFRRQQQVDPMAPPLVPFTPRLVPVDAQPHATLPQVPFGPCPECTDRARRYYEMLHHDHVRAGALPLLEANWNRAPILPDEPRHQRAGRLQHLPTNWLNRSSPRVGWPDPYDGVM